MDLENPSDLMVGKKIVSYHNLPIGGCMSKRFFRAKLGQTAMYALEAFRSIVQGCGCGNFVIECEVDGKEHGKPGQTRFTFCRGKSDTSNEISAVVDVLVQHNDYPRGSFTLHFPPYTLQGKWELANRGIKVSEIARIGSNVQLKMAGMEQPPGSFVDADDPADEVVPQGTGPTYRQLLDAVGIPEPDLVAPDGTKLGDPIRNSNLYRAFCFSCGQPMRVTGQELEETRVHYSGCVRQPPPRHHGLTMRQRLGLRNTDS